MSSTSIPSNIDTIFIIVLMFSYFCVSIIPIIFFPYNILNKTFIMLVSLPKQPRHIPHTPISFPQQLRLANLHQRAGFAAFAVVRRRGLAAV